MNISGIRPYAGFYEYNSIKSAEIRSQQIAAVQPQDSRKDSGDSETQEVLAPAMQEVPTYNAYDFAQTYQPNETFELKGADSDIYSLDIQKAVSDLEKDQVLQQYQYFVGSKSDVVTRDSDPVAASLRSGENFSL